MRAQGAAPGTGIPGERLKGNRNTPNLHVPRLRRERGLIGWYWHMPAWWQRARIRELGRTLRPDTVASLVRRSRAETTAIIETRS